ncbi:MAG: triose-phosphate isomerase [Legionellales bacterium]|nr:triose-phosphate isomerase [Legionellales bacterium]
MSGTDKGVALPLLIANWKMNGAQGMAQALLSEIKAMQVDGLDFVVMTPFPYLAMAQNILSGSRIAWGAQSVHDQCSGAFTGEVSASMLKDFKCQYVLVGHSERRALRGEQDTQIAYQAMRVIEAGMMPVICVGETGQARDLGRSEVMIQDQVKSVLEVFKTEGLGVIECVWAYEPVWAIGQGLAATPNQASQGCQAIRQALSESGLEFSSKCRMIYGGSVNEANIQSFVSAPFIDGVLIGGASLDSRQLNKMVKMCMV